MLNQKTKSAMSELRVEPSDHMDPASERLGEVFVFAALSGEDFLEEDHERAIGEEPIVEASYPTSWKWTGRPGDHRP